MLGFALAFGYVALGAALLLTCVRLVRGPSLADRVVALDLVAYLVIGFLAVHALAAGQPVLLDAAITLALVAFLGTVAFARHVERVGTRARPGARREAPREEDR